MAFIEAILLIAVVLFIIYKWAVYNNDYFEKRNIPFIKPTLIFGNLGSMFLQTENMLEFLKRLHSHFNSPVYGMFEMRNPMIVLKDIELVKQVTVKDFDHFMNHRVFIEPQDDLLFGNSLFAMKDQKWKDMRATLSPAFTGSKMRLMFQLIREVCDEGMSQLKQKANLSESNEIVLETKDFFTHYTNDVIASTAFGLKINSISEPDHEFYQMGRKATNFTRWILIKFSLFTNFRTLMRFFKIKLFDTKFTSYFMRLVNDQIKYRSENNIIRPDMINMLIAAQKSKEKPHSREWSDTELVAQCFLFFIAGFETTASLMSFASQEIMENPNVQKKLLEEVDEMKEKLNGQPITYEDLHGMKYLDMVISETLRKWPGSLATDRVCTKPVTLKTDDISLDLNVGDIITILITGMHYDPDNFPNPEKFDPERFSDENKGNIKPFTYAPFGLGPRNCIGSRFALMEAKVIIYSILCSFTIEVSEKTDIPVKLKKSGFQLQAENGFWIKLVPRT